MKSTAAKPAACSAYRSHGPDLVRLFSALAITPPSALPRLEGSSSQQEEVDRQK